MSGKIGTCINCGDTDMGIYTIDCCRGWNGDKYNFNVEICEKCIGKITAKWKFGTMTADKVYVFARKEQVE